MNGVLQFFNCYHHIKFQANISNDYRVLEAIPPKNPVSGNFRELRGGSKLVSYGVVFFNTLIISDLQQLIFPIFIKCVFSALFCDSGRMSDPQLLKFCLKIWLSSQIITKIRKLKFEFKHLVKKIYIYSLMCLLSHQKIPSYSALQGKPNEASWL